jgi:predicted nucleotidyltransferase
MVVREKTTMAQIDAKLMDEIVRRIVEVIQPEKVILFGSQARDEARPESDIDLLVIAKSTRPRYRRSAPLYGALSDILVPMDILVYSPEEVKEWSEVRQAFVTTAIREGKVIYEN